MLPRQTGTLVAINRRAVVLPACCHLLRAMTQPPGRLPSVALGWLRLAGGGHFAALLVDRD